MTVFKQMIWYTETFQGYLLFCAGTLPSYLGCSAYGQIFYTAGINESDVAWLPVETLHLVLTTGDMEKREKIAGANS